MMYMMNDLRCTFMNYYIEFSNAFDFICWFIYSLSKLPCEQNFICDPMWFKWAICFVPPKSSIWSTFVKLVYACNVVIYIRFVFDWGCYYKNSSHLLQTPIVFHNNFLTWLFLPKWKHFLKGMFESVFTL